MPLKNPRLPTKGETLMIKTIAIALFSLLFHSVGASQTPLQWVDVKPEHLHA
jgi:hypothetical protein